jgi:hypothetical protein
VNQSSSNRGSISKYDIDRGHALVKLIETVPDVDDVHGVTGSSEDMVEVDFANGKIERVGDQFGIGRVTK